MIARSLRNIRAGPKFADFMAPSLQTGLSQNESRTFNQSERSRQTSGTVTIYSLTTRSNSQIDFHLDRGSVERYVMRITHVPRGCIYQL